MNKKIHWLSIIILCLVGCSEQPKENTGIVSYGPDVQVPAGLWGQQLLAYPMLEDNTYLTLKNFESADDLADFGLVRAGGQDAGESKLLYSASPTATGTGALGISLGVLDDYTLIFDTPIRRWKDYNLLFCAIFIDETKASCEIELADGTGKSGKMPFLLTQGWNKLQIDLSDLAGKIDMNDVSRMKISFYQIGGTKVFIDDLILIDYHKSLVGHPDGAGGTRYAVREGKRIRVGACGRFEVVFNDGKLIGWYDLGSDRERTNNLLPAGSQGVEILQGMSDGNFEKIPMGDAMVSSRAQFTAIASGQMELKVENYFGSHDGDADQQFVYHIFPDGLILVDITAQSETDRLGLSLGVADDQGFDAVIGKMKNPAVKSETRVEYGLFRRMGKRAGADMLLAFQPWESGGALQCKLSRNQKGHGGLRAIFTGDARIGQNVLHGMIRVWPANIDNLGNAEKYIREFLDPLKPGCVQEKSATQWQPTWDLNKL
jgi:hypothetical protein